jgi:hypothetical protein
MTHPDPKPAWTSIRVGDKFRSKTGAVLEVTATKPGGKVEMIDRDRCWQMDRWAFQVRDMERCS